MEDKLTTMNKKLNLSKNETIADSKSIIIDGKLHKQYKDYCRVTKKKIGGQTEDMIRLYLSNPNELQKQIEELRKGGQEI